MKLIYAGYSSAGHKDHNQDAILARVPTDNEDLRLKGAVACIADGASASQYGQQASHTLATSFVEDYYATPNTWSIKKSVQQSLTALNTWLFQHASSSSHTSLISHTSMVSTFSAVILKENNASIFHVGDSRIYLLRQGQLRQLTRDHISYTFTNTKQLTRAIGLDSHIEIDYQKLALEPHDTFILTTDGMHDHFPLKVFEQQLNKSIKGDLAQDDIADICQSLCQNAMEHGSLDNTSCFMFHIQALETNLSKNGLAQKRIPAALKPAQKLDKYEIIKSLHASSRSHLYLAQDQAGQKYCLKVPSLNMSEDNQYLAHFQNESWLARELQHPNILDAYPLPKNSPYIYQVLEYIEGNSLRQWMLDHPKPELSQVREILAQLIPAMRKLQRADVVHADLKPENIMLTRDKHLKLIDFGAATALKDTNRVKGKDEDSLPMGDLDYLAPEYLQDGDITWRADLFSAAVITYEMLSGELPFKRQSIQNVKKSRHVQWQYKPLYQARPDLPEWVDACLEKALSFTPHKRHQAWGEFLTELQTPNPSALRERMQQPLLKRDPVLFWKGFAWVSFVIALGEFLLLLKQ